MSISAVKGFIGVAVAIAVAMFLAAMSTAFDRRESLALVLGAAVLAVAATLWYRRAMAAAEAREEARQPDQLAALKQQLALTREPIAVRAASGVLFLALPACVAVYYAGLALVHPDLGSILGLALGLFVTVGFGLIYGPRIGKPALTIRPDGIEAPVIGCFAWNEIESIGLQTYTSQGATTHSLDLHVPRLRDREERLRPLQRLARRAFLRAGSNVVAIHLVQPSLPPTLVHTLCHDLWKQATGRSTAQTDRRLPEEHATASAREFTTKLVIIGVALVALTAVAAYFLP